VVILFGGRSAEHEISLLSARNIVGALDRARFSPFLIGIDKQGRWHLESQATLDSAVGDPRAVHLDAAAPLTDASVLKAGDVVFPAVHGTYGEDGTLQGLLELADVAYVGAPVLGSAIGMDKDVAKRLLRDAGIAVVPYRLVTARAFRTERDACLRAGAELGFPLFCKPANAGSSVGVTKVDRPEQLAGALALALQFDSKVLLERGIDAREVECAVLGNDEPQASIPGEIVLSHRDGFYSYDAKYVDPQGAEFRVPADLPAETAKRVHILVRSSGLAQTMSRYLVRRIEEHGGITVHPETEIVAPPPSGKRNEKSNSLHLGSFLFGMGYRVADNVGVNLDMEIGATDDAPDMRAFIRVPIAFSLF